MSGGGGRGDGDKVRGHGLWVRGFKYVYRDLAARLSGAPGMQEEKEEEEEDEEEEEGE